MPHSPDHHSLDDIVQVQEPMAVFGVSPKTLAYAACTLMIWGRLQPRLAGETPAKATGTVALPKPVAS